MAELAAEAEAAPAATRSASVREKNIQVPLHVHAPDRGPPPKPPLLRPPISAMIMWSRAAMLSDTPPALGYKCLPCADMRSFAATQQTREHQVSDCTSRAVARAWRLIRAAITGPTSLPAMQAGPRKQTLWEWTDTNSCLIEMDRLNAYHELNSIWPSP